MLKYFRCQIEDMISQYLIESDKAHEGDLHYKFYYRSLAYDCKYAIIENYMPAFAFWPVDVLFVAFHDPAGYMIFQIKDGKLEPMKQANPELASPAPIAH